MKNNRRLVYSTILFAILMLILGLTFSCGDMVSTSKSGDLKKDSTYEYSVIISGLVSPLVDEFEEYFVVTDDYLLGTVSQADHKRITIEMVKNINLTYNEFRDITPAKDYEEVHKKFNDAMDRFSVCAVFLKNYVDEDNKRSMQLELMKFNDEVNYAFELLNDATKELNNVVQSQKKDQEIIDSGGYKIIYTSFDRADGAPTLYVLINTQDLDNDDFKDNIKGLIIDITSDKGNKISIDIYDDERALRYGNIYDHGNLDQWENIVNDQDIINHLAVHCLATFDGELDTGMYFNTLWFFIFSDQVENNLIEEYAEAIEFNP